MAQPQKFYLKDYQKPSFSILDVGLRFDLYEGYTEVTNKMRFCRQKDDSDLVLNGEELELQQIKLDGRILDDKDYGLTDKELKIWNVPGDFSLEVKTKIFPEENKSYEGLYKSDGFYVTQNEAQGFRKITYFLDRPDVMSSYQTVITADKELYPILLSNGNLVSEQDLPDGRHQAIWKDPFKKPCYLFALVAGDMGMIQDKFTTCRKREVDLRIYCDKGSEGRCHYAMESLKRSMKWDEERFGLEYDLDVYMIVAVNNFNAGAMENKGLNVFNASYILADPKTATDMDFQNIEAVVGHEYFHNWTGNRITLRDWFQLSLKEGLTVFRDQEFTSDLHSREVKRIEDVRLLRERQFAEDAGPMAHPVRPESAFSVDNFFSLTIYEKGAELIRMIYTFLGRDGFRKAMEKYVELYDEQAVTTDDFVKAMEVSSGHDFTQFRRWYSQAGTPRLLVQGTYNEQEKTYTLEVEQFCLSTPGQVAEEKKPFYLPLSVGLLSSENGDEIDLIMKGQNLGKETILTVSERKQKFEFQNLKKTPIPSLMREFSSPVNLEFNYSDEDLAFLMIHEKDSFVRWEAMQKLTMRVLQQMMKSLDVGEEAHVPTIYLEAYGQILRNENLDGLYKSQLMTLPNENYLTRLLGWERLEEVHEVRRTLLQALLVAHKELFLNNYEKFNTVKEYSLSHVEIGCRALKNHYLSFLLEFSDEYIDVAMEQFLRANNMTDQISALSCLAHWEHSKSLEAKELFYRQWRGNPLVFNKLLRVVAFSSVTSLRDLQKTAELPEFDNHNPNCVYSLFYAFADQNVKGFHNLNDDCYDFFAQLIVNRDQQNPHVGSRLASVFNSWKKLNKERQCKIEPLLRQILAGNTLSSNTYEVISKSLG